MEARGGFGIPIDLSASLGFLDGNLKVNASITNLNGYYYMFDYPNIIDALETKVDDEFDLIFIDAAKGQNIRFFELFSKNLKRNGTIITDNLNFHGLVNKDIEEIESRNVRGLVRKIRDYITFLKENREYETEFIDVGDGLAVSIKREG